MNGSTSGRRGLMNFLPVGSHYMQCPPPVRKMFQRIHNYKHRVLPQLLIKARVRQQELNRYRLTREIEQRVKRCTLSRKTYRGLKSSIYRKS